MNKKRKFKVSYRELAKAFYVNSTQIGNWIRVDKFKADDLYSIGLFFVTQIVNVIERKLEWDDLMNKYKLRMTSRAENDFIEERLKDWDRKEEIRAGMWK